MYTNTHIYTHRKDKGDVCQALDYVEDIHGFLKEAEVGAWTRVCVLVGWLVGREGLVDWGRCGSGIGWAAGFGLVWSVPEWVGMGVGRGRVSLSVCGLTIILLQPHQ